MFRRPCVRRSVALALLGAAALPLAAAAQALVAPEPLPPRNWNQVRVEVDGVSLVLTRAQARNLAELMLRAAAAPAAPVPASGPAIAQFEFGRGAETVGVLSLHGDRWHWAAAGDPRAARTLQVDALLSQALLQEAQKLLHR